ASNSHTQSHCEIPAVRDPLLPSIRALRNQTSEPHRDYQTHAQAPQMLPLPRLRSPQPRHTDSVQQTPSPPEPSLDPVSRSLHMRDHSVSLTLATPLFMTSLIPHCGALRRHFCRRRSPRQQRLLATLVIRPELPQTALPRHADSELEFHVRHPCTASAQP